MFTEEEEMMSQGYVICEINNTEYVLTLLDFFTNKSIMGLLEEQLWSRFTVNKQEYFQLGGTVPRYLEVELLDLVKKIITDKNQAILNMKHESEVIRILAKQKLGEKDVNKRDN